MRAILPVVYAFEQRASACCSYGEDYSRESRPDLLGRRYPHIIDKRDTAVEGMRTACGATLIASQSNSTISDEGEGHASTRAAVAAAASALPLSPTPTLCLECLIAAAKSGATMVMRG